MYLYPLCLGVTYLIAKMGWACLFSDCHSIAGTCLIVIISFFFLVLARHGGVLGFASC